MLTAQQLELSQLLQHIFEETSQLPEDLPQFFDIKNIPKDMPIFTEGAPADFMAFILRGSVEIKKETEFKGKNVVLSILHSGNFLGEMIICGDGKTHRTTTATALEDTQLAILSYTRVCNLISKHPELGFKFCKHILLEITRRLMASNERLTAVF